MCTVFSNEEEALGFALIHRIDLFLVDIILHPQRENDFSGITFVEKIRECPSCAGADVVFITSLAGLEVDLLHRVHCYDYIEKPIEERKIRQLVDELLNRGEKASKLPERMYFRNDGIVFPVNVAEIRYVVHQNRVLSVYDGKECIEVPNLPLKRFLSRVRDSVFLSPLRGRQLTLPILNRSIM